MAVEVRPLGVTCNIACAYCYQAPQRRAGNTKSQYDLLKIKEALLAENKEFTLFGGEPLLMPIADLQELFAFGFAQFGGSGLQTNGVLITSEHIELFKTYNVRVSVSIDGPNS